MKVNNILWEDFAMAFKVDIDGFKLEKCIVSLHLDVDTPNDSDARFTHAGNSMEIVGRIDTNEPTCEMYRWSLLPAQDGKAYRKIKVTIMKENETIREVSFTKAFVVDYCETYSSESGDGIFTLRIKQKKDLNEDITVDGF